jgi:outer membrane protein assembly factor BamB
MSLRSFTIGCAGILLLLGCWAVFGAIRSLRKRQWRGVFIALVALCLFVFAEAPVSYLAGVGAPHAIHNKPAPVSDSAITYYFWGESGSVGNPPSQLFALRARTGALVWQKSLPSCAACVEVDGDTVYGISYGISGGNYTSTEAFALDAATGATRWQRTVDGMPTANALRLVGDTLLLDVTTHGALSAPTPAPNDITPTSIGGEPLTTGIVALNPSDGQELWRVSLSPMYSNTIPIIGGTNVFYDLPNASTVEARSLSDGHLLWATTVANGIFLAGPDPVFTLSDDGAVTALNATDGATRWSFGDHETFSRAALSGGTLFVAAQRSDVATYSSDNPQTVYALDAASGVLRWQFPTHSPAVVELYASGDTVYVAGGSGMYALRTVDGTVRWHMGSTNNWGISPFTPIIGSALYVAHIATVPPDAFISLAVPKQQVYISAVDTRDGSLCWSVPAGPEFAHGMHL